MSKQTLKTTDSKPKKAMLVGVFTNTSTLDQENQMNELEGLVLTPVSYTHLTLPTSDLV